MKTSPLFAIFGTFMAVLSPAIADIAIEDFANPHHEWEVMTDEDFWYGSSLARDIRRGVWSDFEGLVQHSSIFNADGFVKSRSIDSFPSLANCAANEIELHFEVPYNGCYLAFREQAQFINMVPPPHYQWRTRIDPGMSDGGRITIPLTDFSSGWNLANGRIDSECSSDPSV
eukprot:CAMPEP_0198126576 /NCGR_PEP_ID=MMETSP1442-20131203/45143_1 /TAXON_ID= /ORGANISM="Craspedostauros australis, Strain CCMP3328" /LENGTH=171 /DNA_ID=CAMNT_0043786383 /DNA_START=178 /DNA_END=693 /DNA_ORIENTATION=-